jgi:hypothetical protein
MMQKLLQPRKPFTLREGYETIRKARVAEGSPHRDVTQEIVIGLYIEDERLTAERGADIWCHSPMTETFSELYNNNPETNPLDIYQEIRKIHG